MRMKIKFKKITRSALSILLPRSASVAVAVTAATTSASTSPAEALPSVAPSLAQLITSTITVPRVTLLLLFQSGNGLELALALHGEAGRAFREALQRRFLLLLGETAVCGCLGKRGRTDCLLQFIRPLLLHLLLDEHWLCRLRRVRLGSDRRGDLGLRN